MKNNTLPLFFFLILLFSCKNNSTTSDNFNENWSIFRGNTSLSGCANVTLPANPVLLWSFKSEASTRSSPVVYNRIAYWSSRRGQIFGVNFEGKKVFDYNMETAVDAIPMIKDSVLYIGRIDGNLCAISLAKQEMLWSFETYGQIMASPNSMKINDKEAIVFGSYDNYVYGVDCKEGTEINRFESGYYINGAVALTENYAVFGGCDGWVRVVDCDACIQTDSLDVGVYIPASPAIHNNQCYVADHSGNLYEINLDNGKIISSKKIIEAQDDSDSFVSVPAVSDKMVYVVSNDRHIYAIHRKERTVAWKYLLKGATGESSPVICKDKLLVCTKTGIISIHNTKTGELLWDYDTGEQILASPAVVKGCFYILTQKGTLFCFGERKKG